jgi:HAD superfamily hydrolase (TIGR01509 family)
MSERALPKCVLFDLGGVIIDVDMGRVVAPFTSEVIDTSLAEDWYKCAAIDNFERGRIGAAEFGEAIVGELALVCTAAQFLERFEDIHRGLFAGAAELLEGLAAKTHVACFSNINALHWSSQCRDLHIDGYFQTHVLSFELGHRKPDRAAFRAAAELLSVAPEDITFFDDRAENVDGAHAAGFAAHLVAGPGEAAAILGVD